MSPLIRSALRGPTAFSIMGGHVVVPVLTLLVVPPLFTPWFPMGSP